MHGVPNVYKLDPKAEVDFRRKSGPLELVLVLKSDGGVDVYHTSQVQEIKQPRHGTTTVIHRGKDRDPASDADIEKQLKDDGLDKMNLEAIDFHDKGLTEIVREVAPEAFSANVLNATEHVTPLAFMLLKNSCCVSGGGWTFFC